MRAYWGASYLLAQGDRFNEHDILMELQHKLTGFDLDFAQMTWNPPWILVLFIPLTWLSFNDATLLWFFISLFCFIWSLEAIWAAFPLESRNQSNKLWLYAFTFMFLSFWNTLAVGQITTILLFGIAGSIYYSDRHPFVAGVCFSLVTAKPHLVLLTLPILLIDISYHKNWRFLAGFLLTITVLTGVGLWLRPELFVDYLTPTGSDARVSQIASPFLPYAIASMVNWIPIRFIGVIFVPIGLYIWWRFWRNFNAYGRTLQLVSVTQLFSMMLSPYGFSFDHILILPTVWVVVMGATSKSIKLANKILVLSILLFLYWGLIAFPLLQLQAFHLFVWLPFGIGLTYWIIRPFKITNTSNFLPYNLQVSQKDIG